MTAYSRGRIGQGFGFLGLMPKAVDATERQIRKRYSKHGPRGPQNCKGWAGENLRVCAAQRGQLRGSRGSIPEAPKAPPHFQGIRAANRCY